MADLFDSFDSYIGKLNTSNPDKVMHKLSSDVVNNMNEAAKFQSDVGKGLGTALVGTPGDFEGIGRGAVEAAPVAYQGVMQLLGAATDALGIEGVSNAIKTLYGSEQNRTALEALMDGMSKDTILPTTEDVQQYLTENYGVQFDDNAATFLGYILAPGGYIAKGKQALKAGKEVIEKGVSKVSEGMDVAKKSFSLPKTVFHGTDAKFDEFQSAKNGIYFTDNPEIAKRFGKNMKEVELKMENPYVIDDFSFDSGMGEKFERWKNKIKKIIGSKNYGRTTKSNAWSVDPDTINRLQDKGYDGIAIPSSVSSSGDNRYIVFDASQIITKGN